MAHPVVKLYDVLDPRYNALEFPWDQVCLIVLGHMVFKFIRSGDARRDIYRLRVIANLEYSLKLKADLLVIEDRLND